MNLKFLENQLSDLNQFSGINLRLLLQDPNEFSSFVEEKLNHPDIQYRLIELNTVFKGLKPSSLEFKPLFDNNLNNPLQTEIQQQAVLAKKLEIIIKDKTLKKMNDTITNLHKECEEEGFKKFSDIAEKNSRQILSAIYDRFPNYEYYIYPTADCEIAIDCNPQKGKGVLILCDSNGSIACFATFDGKNHRFRYDSIDRFPYKLLWETFEEFDKQRKYFSQADTTKIVLPISPSSGELSPIIPLDLFGTLSDQYECA